MSRPASRRITPVIAVIGRDTPRTITQPDSAQTSAAIANAPKIQSRAEA
jgi:hypothetical protein